MERRMSDQSLSVEGAHQSNSLEEETVPVSAGLGVQHSVTPPRGEEFENNVFVL